MADLFTSSNAPETSFEAADKLRPYVGTISEQVQAFAKDRGAVSADGSAGGFIDEDLIALGQDWQQGDRSYRTRRTALTDQNIILDSGHRRLNQNKNRCVVWVHRDFVPQPPPIRDASRPKTEIRPEAEQMISNLKAWARQMRNEGRAPFADGLLEAAALMSELAS